MSESTRSPDDSLLPQDPLPTADTGTDIAVDASQADAETVDASQADADAVDASQADPDTVALDGDAPAFAAGDDLTEVPVRPRRRLAVVLSAAAVAVAVLLGGGAFALARMWNGPTGTLPEDLVPASVAAFARIDLSPGIGQRVKVEALLRKAGGNGPKTLDDTKRDIFADLEAPIGYDDVASWFDDRIGVAMWAAPEPGAKAVTLVVASSRDDAKARKALTAAQQKAGTDDLGFVVGDGHVLLAFDGKDLQRAAAAAAAAAAKAPLSKDPAFTAAVAKLPAGQPGLAWADLARADDLAQEFLAFGVDGDVEGEETDAEAAGPPVALPELKGTVVVGVQAGDDGLELRARVSGGSGLPLTATSTGTDALALLGALPADATAAGAAGGPLGDLSLLGGAGVILSSTLFPLARFGGLADDIDLADLPPPPGVDPNKVITLPPGVDLTDPAAIEKYFREHPELGDGTVVRSFTTTQPSSEEVQKAIQALDKAMAAATSVTFAVAGPEPKEHELGEPLQVDLRLADAAAAKQLQADLAALLKAGGTVCEVHEEHVVLRTKTFAAGTGGKLADSERFRAATAGGVPGATAAFYVDGERGGTAPAKGIGVTVGHDGTDTVVMARVLIG
ncbi:hypothetical protein GCM10009827_077070 [Dactylosporangium maewongense]|uniref:DUF3352 domain-containing protein n=1 Tax=Dactylosporangium maewongense TaxID=634393 RepID=A0ABN2BS25_9ACTN